jgi:hypothetical protein
MSDTGSVKNSSGRGRRSPSDKRKAAKEKKKKKEKNAFFEKLLRNGEGKKEEEKSIRKRKTMEEKAEEIAVKAVDDANKELKKINELKTVIETNEFKEIETINETIGEEIQGLRDALKELKKKKPTEGVSRETGKKIQTILTKIDKKNERLTEINSTQFAGIPYSDVKRRLGQETYALNVVNSGGAEARENFIKEEKSRVEGLRQEKLNNEVREMRLDAIHTNIEIVPYKGNESGRPPGLILKVVDGTTKEEFHIHYDSDGKLITDSDITITDHKVEGSGIYTHATEKKEKRKITDRVAGLADQLTRVPDDVKSLLAQIQG